MVVPFMLSYWRKQHQDKIASTKWKITKGKINSLEAMIHELNQAHSSQHTEEVKVCDCINSMLASISSFLTNTVDAEGSNLLIKAAKNASTWNGSVLRAAVALNNDTLRSLLVGTNQFDCNALLYAAMQRPEAVREILKAAIEIKDEAVRTDVLRTMLCQTGKDGVTPLKVAASNHPEVVTDILHAALSISDEAIRNDVLSTMLCQISSKGNNALMIAACQHPQLIHTILNAAVAITNEALRSHVINTLLCQLNNKGWSALRYAAKDNPDLTLILLPHIDQLPNSDAKQRMLLGSSGDGKEIRDLLINHRTENGPHPALAAFNNVIENIWNRVPQSAQPVSSSSSSNEPVASAPSHLSEPVAASSSHESAPSVSLSEQSNTLFSRSSNKMNEFAHQLIKISGVNENQIQVDSQSMAVIVAASKALDVIKYLLTIENLKMEMVSTNDEVHIICTRLSNSFGVHLEDSLYKDGTLDNSMITGNGNVSPGLGLPPCSSEDSDETLYSRRDRSFG